MVNIKAIWGLISISIMLDFQPSKMKQVLVLIFISRRWFQSWFEKSNCWRYPSLFNYKKSLVGNKKTNGNTKQNTCITCSSRTWTFYSSFGIKIQIKNFIIYDWNYEIPLKSMVDQEYLLVLLRQSKVQKTFYMLRIIWRL